MNSKHLTDDFPEVEVGFQCKSEYSDILIELIDLQWDNISLMNTGILEYMIRNLFIFDFGCFR